MKIAILTLTGDNNYGNKLQNFAVQWNLENLGHSTKTIRIGRHNKFLIKSLLARLLFPFRKYLGKYGVKLSRIVAFADYNKNIHQSYFSIKAENENKLRNTLAQFEKIVYGSDQIWNPEMKAFGKAYLGYYAPREKNISICASFGASNVSEPYRTIISEGLNNFASISVREYSGQDLVVQLSGRDAVVLPDPTLTVPKEVWIKQEKWVSVPKRYVLTYFLGSRPEKELITSKDDALEVISADPSSQYGPGELLYLIHNAEMVCTDSYHACIFSILYGKHFRVFQRRSNYTSMTSRIDTLFDKMGIIPAYGNHYIEIYENQLKQDAIKQKIQKEREQFCSYLNCALS